MSDYDVYYLAIGPEPNHRLSSLNDDQSKLFFLLNCLKYVVTVIKFTNTAKCCKNKASIVRRFIMFMDRVLTCLWEEGS